MGKSLNIKICSGHLVLYVLDRIINFCRIGKHKVPGRSKNNPQIRMRVNLSCLKQVKTSRTKVQTQTNVAKKN